MLKRIKMIGFYIASILAAVIIAATAGYVYAAGQAPATPLASQPMIDVEARTSYQRGEISRAVAHKQIATRLDTLLNQEAIADWQYNEETFTYTITLNNNTIFEYTLK